MKAWLRVATEEREARRKGTAHLLRGPRSRGGRSWSAAPLAAPVQRAP